MSTPSIAFFGTPDAAVTVLDELKSAGIIPAVVITTPDAPRGRGMVLTPPPVKVWAEENDVLVLQPETLKDEAAIAPLLNSEWDLFIVAAYGKIIPASMLALPKHGTLNVHPSMLPKFRGASPVRSAILENQPDAIGVSIMLLDEEVDHGPIIAQARVQIDEWPPSATLLEDLLFTEGGKLLAEVIPLWIEGKITPEPQDHSQATFCGKITKDMGALDLTDNPEENLRKIRALDGSYGTYFFIEREGKKMRVKIIDAEIAENGTLTLTRVTPEGKKEMSGEEFTKNFLG